MRKPERSSATFRWKFHCKAFVLFQGLKQNQTERIQQIRATEIFEDIVKKAIKKVNTTSDIKISLHYGTPLWQNPEKITVAQKFENNKPGLHLLRQNQ